MRSPGNSIYAAATAFPMLAVASTMGQVPVYTVEPIANYSVTTTLTNAGPAGNVCGWQVIAGQVRGFVASVDQPLSLLPLPPGYISSTALDVNSDGVVVGAVAQNNFPYDLGEPAIWTPDGNGGYSITIPEQFETLPSPLGELSINGGMAVGINDDGTIVGWSRYQGFQGGPATQFQVSGPPTNLNALGFQATPTDLSETGLICGGGLRMDLNTGEITSLGVPAPAGGVSFTVVFAYSVNDGGQVVAAARRATSTNDRWLTYVYEDGTGWFPLNPNQIPSPFVGSVYDNNNLNDVSAAGGVLFREEDILVPGYNGLIDPALSTWTAAIGFINDDRAVYTTATNSATGQSAIVRLAPITTGCDEDLNADGVVDSDDLAVLLGAFGNSDAGDINEDGSTDSDDLGMLLSAFGSACG
ncbi:MAG: hypothetical protein ACTS3F_03765 [Phycisphaerales bacterium]